VLAGVTVESTEKSNRFIWDFWRTQADHWAAYARTIRAWANQHGLLFYSEIPYHGNPNGVEVYSHVDVPMAECWPEERLKGKTLQGATADFWGRNICAIEAFSCGGLEKYHPSLLKACGDSMLAAGHNRIMALSYDLHTTEDIPGLWFAGTVFNRHQTGRKKRGRGFCTSGASRHCSSNCPEPPTYCWSKTSPP